ncbi:hypothetical protein niasHS_011776 [Heterodera schachtii]|uniref:Metalloendopeptidase n=1 Tax=Heterodera schachtii TaxID=97005 RepID=A0ABD2I826_HETSC
MQYNCQESFLRARSARLSEHAKTEQVVGRDGGRRKKSDERHRRLTAGARRAPTNQSTACGSRADFFRSRSLAPPTGRRSRVPEFSKRIINDTDLLPYQNDPNNTRRATPCIGKLWKERKRKQCGFQKARMGPTTSARDAMEKAIQFTVCGLKPEEVKNQRKKRQYHPYQKWTESPIKITFNKTALPKDGYQKWKDAIEIGAALIMEVTCVRFEFVDEMVEGENGIAIADTLTACGMSPVGRVGGWQFLQLGMTMSRHEQSRSDARDYVILRKNDGFSKTDHYTQNFGFPYDFGSVMHYRADGDHKNGLYDRITLPRFYQQTIGQMERISFKDAAIINRIYCKDSCKGHEDKCQNGGYLNPNDCTKCHCPDGYGGEYCKELEENLNCEDLSGIPRELLANQSAVLLMAEAKCNVKLIKSSKCRYAGNLFVEKRNPGSGTLQCYDAVKQKYNDCPCAGGEKKCLTEEKWSYDHFVCPILKVNGIQISKHPRYNWARIDIKAEGDTVSFWGYSKPETKEIIRVDEVHCLQAWAVAGGPK